MTPRPGRQHRARGHPVAGRRRRVRRDRGRRAAVAAVGAARRVRPGRPAAVGVAGRGRVRRRSRPAADTGRAAGRRDRAGHRRPHRRVAGRAHRRRRPHRRRSAPRWPPRTAPGPWRPCCARSSWPGTTRARSSPRRSSGASCDDARKISYVIQDRINAPRTARPGRRHLHRPAPAGRRPAVGGLPGRPGPRGRRRRRRARRAGRRRAAAVGGRGPRPAARRPDAERDAAGSRGPAQVAAHRDVMGHDAADDALGQPPKPGQVEQYASWRTAWRALGRPEADRAEAEMSRRAARVSGSAPTNASRLGAAVRRRRTGRHPAGRRPRTPHRDAAGRRSRRQHRRRRAQRLRTEAEQAKALAEASTRAPPSCRSSTTPARCGWRTPPRPRPPRSAPSTELEARGIDNSDDGPTAEEWLDQHRGRRRRRRPTPRGHRRARPGRRRRSPRRRHRRRPARRRVRRGRTGQRPARQQGREPDQVADEIPDAEIVADDNTTPTTVEPRLSQADDVPGAGARGKPGAGRCSPGRGGRGTGGRVRHPAGADSRRDRRSGAPCAAGADRDPAPPRGRQSRTTRRRSRPRRGTRPVARRRHEHRPGTRRSAQHPSRPPRTAARLWNWAATTTDHV